jgi:cytoskeleton protein RodZ
VKDGVGKTLRDAREQRKLDLAQVEAATRIRARFLRALEDEEWDVLPGETYARAFIRTYADFLGLDGARLAEGHRSGTGGAIPTERLARVEPDPIVEAGSPRHPLGLSPPLVAAIVVIGLLAVVVVAGITGGDGGPPEAPRQDRSAAGGRAGGEPAPEVSRPGPGVSLRLTATAEVWVCLLDAAGEPLLDGQILATGSEAGPFRSGSFTVSLGNGEVSMTVNGQQASIPATSSPIGYTIGAGGEMRELPEGERPTCT